MKDRPALLLFLIIVIGLACSGSGQLRNNEDTMDKGAFCPRWFDQVRTSADTLFQTATATSPNPQFAFEIASQIARDGIAGQIRTHLKSIQDILMKQQGTEADAKFTLAVEQASRQTLSMYLQESKPVKRHEHKEKNMWRSCVLFSCPLQNTRTLLLDNMRGQSNNLSPEQPTTGSRLTEEIDNKLKLVDQQEVETQLEQLSEKICQFINLQNFGSLAVLPFYENDQTGNGLCAYLAEKLAAMLATQPSLRIITDDLVTKNFDYQNRTDLESTNKPALAKQLSVDALLQGQINVAGAEITCRIWIYPAKSFAATESFSAFLPMTAKLIEMRTLTVRDYRLAKLRQRDQRNFNQDQPAGRPEEMIAATTRDLTVTAALPAQATLGVIVFFNENGQVSRLGKFLAEETILQLKHRSEFRIVERALLQQLLPEQHFILQNGVDSQQVQKMGKMLGADALLFGIIYDLGEEIKLYLRMVDVSRTVVLATAAGKFAKTPALAQMLLDADIPQ